MTPRRKTIQMLVTVSVPAWATVTQARQAVRDYLNHSGFAWDLRGSDGLKEGTLRAMSVKTVRRP